MNGRQSQANARPINILVTKAVAATLIVFHLVTLLAGPSPS